MIQEKQKTNLKKGFTLVEVIIVLVVVGILTTLVYKSLSGSKDNIELQNSISTDIKLITEGIAQYKANNINVGVKNYENISAIPVAMYLPRQVEYTLNDADNNLSNLSATADFIHSLGLGESCKFYINSDIDRSLKDDNTLTADGDSNHYLGTNNSGVKMLMDCSSMKTRWDQKLRLNVEKLFVSLMKKYSGKNIFYNYNATGIGASNADLISTNGSADDGIVGIRYYKGF